MLPCKFTTCIYFTFFLFAHCRQHKHKVKRCWCCTFLFLLNEKEKCLTFPCDAELQFTFFGSFFVPSIIYNTYRAFFIVLPVHIVRISNSICHSSPFSLVPYYSFTFLIFGISPFFWLLFSAKHPVRYFHKTLFDARMHRAQNHYSCKRYGL